MNRSLASILSALVLLASDSFAQKPTGQPWQHIQMPSAAAVKKAWVNPPSAYGPEPYYGLNGPVTLDVVRHDLDTMRSLGYRAVTVQYGYGSGMGYLSPEYLKFFRQLVLEAKARDMRVWIVDDAGYPSGFAGGKFSALRPELRMQALVAAERTPVSAHSSYEKAVSPDTVAVTAIRSLDGEVIQIPFSDGRAKWTAPDGDWTVYVVDHAFRTSPTRSDTNPRRAKDTTQSLEDYLNPAATAQYLAFTHDAYKKAVGDEFGKTILGFRGDEPDYSIAGLPWTPDLFKRFAATKGYDIRPFLAAFLQPRDAKLTPQQLRARADYYDVFADMFRDGFFKPQGEWCAANHLEYQVHLNHEEQQLLLAHSEGDFFRDMQYVQVPGIDSIWHQIWFDTVSDFPRFASSAAHVYGHPRAFTESFAAYRPMPDINAARYILNEQFARGINLVETMYFPATSTPGRGGPMPFMRDPGYPALMDYTRRLSYVMSQGRPAADVALLLPAESLWMGDKAADDTFVTTERLLSEHQVDFDVVGEDALASQLTLKPGAFVSQSGNEYRAVLVPRAELLPERLLDRLHQFARSGGRVVFIGTTPEWIAQQNDLNARRATSAEFEWAKIVPGELPVTPTPPMQPPASPPSALEVAPEMLSGILSSLPKGDITLSQPQPALRMIHRKLKDATVYLLFNESAAPLASAVELPTATHGIERWDPQTGRTTPVASERKQDGHRQFSLDLPAYGTELLVVQ